MDPREVLYNQFDPFNVKPEFDNFHEFRGL